MSARLQIKYIDIDKLIPYTNNARTHSDNQIELIAASINEFGFKFPITIDENMVIVAGHGRLTAAKKAGLKEVPTILTDDLTPEQVRALRVADNRLAEIAEWDYELLNIELGDLQGLDFDIDLTGFGDFDFESDSSDYGGQSGGLSEDFLIPPFTVLNAREGWWQSRKRQWIDLGIVSGEGRPDNLLSFSNAAKLLSYKSETLESSTSIFDPVLCELAYLWFSAEGHTILDPFSGGSVRGIVAATLNRQYVGVDLRREQIEANKDQISILSDDQIVPDWREGDSRDIDRICLDVKADLIFSCPPYADLEVYSDDPADISNMEYNEFVTAYREIVKKSCRLLNDNSFACFVVGEIRDKKGNYHNFVGDTIQAFKDAGMEYYNEAILVTMVGSLPIRVRQPFEKSRKLGKTHQNILVFVKGDSKEAAKRCGVVSVQPVLDQITEKAA